ncbi:hypothetical protein B0H14DRAFT_3896128, partial [Mycena olivaceomarginata]
MMAFLYTSCPTTSLNILSQCLLTSWKTTNLETPHILRSAPPALLPLLPPTTTGEAFDGQDSMLRRTRILPSMRAARPRRFLFPTSKLAPSNGSVSKKCTIPSPLRRSLPHHSSTAYIRSMTLPNWKQLELWLNTIWTPNLRRISEETETRRILYLCKCGYDHHQRTTKYDRLERDEPGSQQRHT